jgi:deoxyribodipyrimidine photo-lyase
MSSHARMQPVILWFRRDLRLQDNPALAAAADSGRPIIPAFIWEAEEGSAAAPGAASRVWLHHSLHALDQSLRERDASLILRAGDSREELRRLVHETNAAAVYWNRRYEPDIIRRDAAIKSELKENGIDAASWNSSALIEPTDLLNASGKPFQVFTPFWKACLKREFEAAVASPRGPLKFTKEPPSSVALEELGLRPRRPWHETMMAANAPGEAAAAVRLKEFVKQSVEHYDSARDIPGIDGTSMLSPHLHFGEIGPRQIVDALPDHSDNPKGSRVFLSEVGWREFARYLLFHFPQTTDTPLKPDFERFPWEPDEHSLRRWQRGETGYPIVDAGMRQLWQTGWMHNRVRMIVASFLIKHLLQPWQRGAEWFWDTLIDADLANNTLGWQWTAGCGADAAPFFRIFNPFGQGEKFDAKGEYVRRWIPELRRLPDKFIHEPWTAPADVLKEAGLELDVHYPSPIVDHKMARARALMAYDKMRL